MKVSTSIDVPVKKRRRPPKEIQFHLFTAAHPNGRELVLLWHDRAKGLQARQGHGAFDSFMYLWVGFNNWAMRVTAADTDRQMIQSLEQNVRLNDAFVKLLNQSEQFKKEVGAFTRFWPIFDVKDIRKKGLRYRFHELDRDTYTKEMLGARVKHAPDGDFDREWPTWSSTIQTIYTVRCNLFHGEKGDSADDSRIVQGAFNTLVGFIDGIDLYRWHSPQG
jgi:hypothetical protein